MTDLIKTVGDGSLVLVILAAAVVLLVSLAAVRFESEGLRRAARRGIALMTVLLVAASAVLLVALLRGEFAFNYIARHTEKALPVGYKIAAFWAGQEGSVLLWTLMLAVMSTICAYWNRREQTGQYAVTLGVLALSIGFLAALMVLPDTEEAHSNPFAVLPEARPDGKGMNPLLQDPGMISHPPILFAGYAACTIPFALLIGALAAGKMDNRWIMQARPWALVAWILLGAGIILGSEWAYTELGWGGYWGWDPVENASLLPWFTATALLHSIFVQQHRGIFKRWNAVLAALTFLLCILAAYITRSGIVQSVHGFGASMIGNTVLVFLILSGLVSLVLIIRRWGDMRPDHRIEELLSKDGALLSGTVLLVLMMVTTMVLTLWPALAKPFSDSAAAMTPTQNAYNFTVLPMALVLAFLMALSPLLSYGKNEWEKLRVALRLPFVLCGVTVIGMLVLAMLDNTDEEGRAMSWFWATLVAALGGIIVGTIGVDLIRSVKARLQATDEGWVAATLLSFDANHRRWGGYLVHVGMMMFIIGVAGSGLFKTQYEVPLQLKQSAEVGGMKVTYAGPREAKGPNYTAVIADLTVVEASGRQIDMHPEMRVYQPPRGQRQQTSEVALRSNWRSDLFVTLGEWADGGSRIILNVTVFPLLIWLWIGGIVMMVGGLWCLVPTLARRPVPVEAMEPKATAGPAGASSRREPKRRAGLALDATN